ncbi:Glycosyltransferase involved in cell wall bisynthesis [Palleronia marisminoris]|uniref:D-inositol 3-phosphate glycosyltransferase n=1 Tax=Palleronia marisminoris TaxID=315423 RepID=A0A1Y5S8X2_9RHOB|nr:glycosyltransferase family 4 protein [Palleronia marisminoris]SFG68523.1 Glycosyltransferase involved in cell wall bisynthesis [Palleronia marisminoris]SLN35043.1 D-inositol 3-phosphate glycosyltransferase [Palleronia marisminoris]
MTIRILFPYVGGDVVGGSHISSLTLAARLDPARFAPMILLHREAGALGRYVESLGLGYEVAQDLPIMAPAYSRMPGDVGIGRYLALCVWRMARVLRDRRIDIVHTNDGRMHANWSLAARLAGARHLWHHREDPTSRGANLIAPLLADRMVSVSRFAMPPRAARASSRRAAIVRSPFDFTTEPPDRDAARRALCAEIGADEGALLLGFVGGLIPRKRPDFFVRVVRAAADAMPDRDVRGLLFGAPERKDSPVEAEVRAAAHTFRIAGRIHLMGHRTPITGPMSAMDALVVPALSEPFGRTLIEAMHLGVPVVASRHGGNIEAIEDGLTGFLVPPDDPAEYVDRIARLDRDPTLRRTLTEAARTAVHERFSPERSTLAIQQIYAEMSARPLRGRPVRSPASSASR